MKNYISRYFWFILGVLINSFGIALITKAAMGTSPISSVPYVLSFRFAPSFGQLTFIFNLFFILGQAVLLRSEFQPIQFLQILVNLIFSACIDLGMYVLSWFTPDSLVTQVLSLLAGCAVLAAGICIEVAPDVLMVPGEGIVKAISTAFGWKFGTVKVAFDTTLMATALALSLFFFGGLQGIGIGTIISALIVGQFVNLWNKTLPLIPYIRRLAEPSAGGLSS